MPSLRAVGAGRRTPENEQLGAFSTQGPLSCARPWSGWRAPVAAARRSVSPRTVLLAAQSRIEGSAPYVSLAFEGSWGRQGRARRKCRNAGHIEPGACWASRSPSSTADDESMSGPPNSLGCRCETGPFALVLLDQPAHASAGSASRGRESSLARANDLFAHIAGGHGRSA